MSFIEDCLNGEKDIQDLPKVIDEFLKDTSALKWLEAFVATGVTIAEMEQIRKLPPETCKDYLVDIRKRYRRDNFIKNTGYTGSEVIMSITLDDVLNVLDNIDNDDMYKEAEERDLVDLLERKFEMPWYEYLETFLENRLA